MAARRLPRTIFLQNSWSVGHDGDVFPKSGGKKHVQEVIRTEEEGV